MPRIINKTRAVNRVKLVKDAQTAIEAYFTANPDATELDFDQVRADMAKDKTALPDGFINQAAQDAGFKVDE